MIKIDKELERLLLSILNEGGINMAYESTKEQLEAFKKEHDFM